MDRIQDPTATVDNQFREAGIGGVATRLRAEWLNGVQEELLHILEQAGITPSTANLTQVLQALRVIFPTKTELAASDGSDYIGYGAGTLTEALVGLASDIVGLGDDIQSGLTGGAPVYADTTSGLAGTTEGDYFNVPSGTEWELLILYRHDSGPVATEVGRTPSSELVKETETRVGSLSFLTNVPWLDSKVIERDGTTQSDWNYAGQPHRLALARAIKQIYIEDADETKEYVISQFGIDHPTDLDRIIIAEDGVQFATNGVANVTKNPDGLTEVVLDADSAGKATVWVDYNELSGLSGHLTTGTDSPLVIGKHANYLAQKQAYATDAVLQSTSPEVLKLKNELGDIPWLADEAYSRTGTGSDGWNYPARPHRIMAARAIKGVYLHNADHSKTYVVSQFNNNNPTHKDRIIIADTGGGLFADTGAVYITKNPDDVTEVVISDNGTLKAVLWIDYREITAETVLTTGTDGPFIIDNAAHQIVNARLQALETDMNSMSPQRRVLELELGPISWLDPAMLDRTGTSSSDWYYVSRKFREVARAIKSISLDGVDETKKYVISNFSIDHPSDLDRIIIATTEGDVFATNNASEVAINPGGVTEVVLDASGTGTARLWIDYRELDGLTGTLASGTDNPLQIALPAAHSVVDERLRALEAQVPDVSDYGKIAFIGDSITEFGDYPERVASIIGATALKFGFGGCRMGRHDTTGAGVYKDWMCMYRLADMIASGDFSDLIQAADDLYAYNGDDNRAQAQAMADTDWSTVETMVVFYGTNDWTGDNIAVGAQGDADGTTYIGAINYSVDKIQTAYPKMNILFLAPLWRARQSSGDGLDADTNPNEQGEYLIEYVDACVTTAAENKLPALDLYRESGINKYNHTTLLGDGLHPVQGVGYQRVAERVGAFIRRTLA